MPWLAKVFFIRARKGVKLLSCRFRFGDYPVTEFR